MNRFTYTSDKGLTVIYREEKVKGIVKYVEEIYDKIIESLPKTSVPVYDYIQKEFKKGDIKNNMVFQYVFSSYYGLNNAGLTYAFRTLFFEIMNDSINEEKIDLNDVVLKLWEERNRKGKKSVQFSFTTKMVHTINNKYPIYDNQIAYLFGFRQPYHIKDFNKKMAVYSKQYDEIKYSYENILKRDMLGSIIGGFRERYNKYQISDIKILDFIFWQAGKIKRRENKEVS